MLIAAVFAATALSAPAEADAPLVCPSSATRQERETPDAREIWCETAAGVREGPRHAFFKDGARWFVGEYAAGKRTGQWRFWYPSGQLRSVGTYRQDKRHGRSEHFHDGAGQAMAGECKDGVEVGLWTRWYPNGNRELEITFAADGTPGRRAFYSRRGLTVDARRWTAEQARGADPTSERFQKALAASERDRFFSECGS